MMSSRKICVVTGSRAEYGLLYSILKELQDATDFELQLVVTGAHLSSQHGLTVRQIEKDGFEVIRKVDMLLSSDNETAVTKSMGLGLIGFADVLNELKPELVMVLGDRYEMMSVAQAALIAKIPLAHIAGGDVTEGAFDESIRHCITKMAHLHFATNTPAASRIRQLGENPANIHVVGSPGIDYIRQMNWLSRQEVESALGFSFFSKNLLITLHPATLEKDNEYLCAQLLDALHSLGPTVGLIFTQSNADPQAQVITEQIQRFVSFHANSKLFSSLGQLLYINTMKQVDAIVGNSSSGFYEAPSLNKPTVNIGNRQKGRLKAASVIDSDIDAPAILKCIENALNMDCTRVENPYGNGFAARKIVEILRSTPDYFALLKKPFFEVV